MRIKNPFKGKSREKESCHQDDNGVVTCKRTRVLEDGTEQELAKVVFQFDGTCSKIPLDMDEYEDGQLAKLESGIVSRVSNRCKNTPSDY